jgi:DDE family transposase
MAAPKRAPVTTHDLQGFKYFRVLGPLLDHWHAAGTTRDRVGNRQLVSDP